jgi:hypothetical protein
MGLALENRDWISLGDSRDVPSRELEMQGGRTRICEGAVTRQDVRYSQE